jgi:Sporulation and spore germination/Immunoglobulin-like domain of bacterial spore germination
VARPTLPQMTVKRRRCLLASATGVAALAAAWSLVASAGGGAGDGRAPAAEPARPLAATLAMTAPVERALERTVAAPQERVAAARSSMDVSVFYLRKVGTLRYLAPERHEVPFSPSPARATAAAVTELLAATPRHLGTARPFPHGTRLLALRVNGGTATVNLSRQALGVSGGDGYAMQALVWTATQAPQVKRVVVEVEGRRAGTLGGRPVSRLLGMGAGGRELVRDRGARLAPILLDEPGAGAAVRDGRVVVRGRARPAGGMVGLRLRDAAGRVVAQGHAALPDASRWAAFSGALSFEPPRGQARWSVEAFEFDPTDASVTYSVAVAVLVGR